MGGGELEGCGLMFLDRILQVNPKKNKMSQPIKENWLIGIFL